MTIEVEVAYYFFKITRMLDFVIIIIIIIISTFINSARVTQCHNGAGWRQRLSSSHQICL